MGEGLRGTIVFALVVSFMIIALAKCCSAMETQDYFIPAEEITSQEVLNEITEHILQHFKESKDCPGDVKAIIAPVQTGLYIRLQCLSIRI